MSGDGTGSIDLEKLIQPEAESEKSAFQRDLTGLSSLLEVSPDLEPASEPIIAELPAAAAAEELPPPQLPTETPVPAEPSGHFVEDRHPISMDRPTQFTEQMRNFADQVTAGKPAMQAALPFSVLIQGRLSPEEREKLMDVIAREQMGFSELDLEPQFQAGKILIPRISEYAGVLIVQAMRGAPVEIRFGLSDGIFSTEDTRSEKQLVSSSSDIETLAYDAKASHAAEDIPITQLPTLPGLQIGETFMLDVVTASAALKTGAVEADSSSEYQEILEALQRELKYKAHCKGAHAIVGFSVNLTSLSVPTHYRITATGTAIRTKA